MTYEEWMASAESRETSRPLMDAIWTAARGLDFAAEDLWSEGYGDIEEVKDILITKGIDPATQAWGAAGTDWVNH